MNRTTQSRLRSAQQFWLRLLVAFSILAAQWAGQLHELSHAQYDLATAAYLKAGAAKVRGDTGGKPQLDHARDHCLVFQGLDCASASAASLPVADIPRFFLAAMPHAVIRRAEHPPFSSRAPPFFS